MIDPHDHYQDDFDDGDCWNCGGEGRVNHCIDGCCVDQDDIYCDLCSTACDICRPEKTAEPGSEPTPHHEGTP